MRVAAGILGLVIVLGAALYLFKLRTAPSGTTRPSVPVDTVGVQADLQAIAQAEQLYLASQGSYASVQELERSGLISFTAENRHGYMFDSQVLDGTHFKITATPVTGVREGQPMYTVDETMQVLQM
jgi:hypothetical protein